MKKIKIFIAVLYDISNKEKPLQLRSAYKTGYCYTESLLVLTNYLNKDLDVGFPVETKVTEVEIEDKDHVAVLEATVGLTYKFVVGVGKTTDDALLDAENKIKSPSGNGLPFNTPMKRIPSLTK